MKHTNSAYYRQRGSVVGKFLFFLVIFAIGYMWKTNSTTAQVMGQSASSLVAEYGQPVSKERIPRPR